jgi:protein-S-isoprenylcysteine O-methyltransferase Ste14
VSETGTPPTDEISHRGVRGAYIRLTIGLALLPVLLFWVAGTIDWRRGWLFYSLLVLLAFASVAWVQRDNPELFAARRKLPKDAKPWDVAIIAVTILASLAILPLAALDDARFGWAPQPVWVQLAGYVLLTAGFMGVTWAQSVNRHFETTIRIQSDRAHAVIDTGPYAWIRHPGYAFAIPMTAGMALSLGSLVALIPVAVIAVVLAIRTLAEDAELKASLPGYTEYAARVKQRWIPGVW